MRVERLRSNPIIRPGMDSRMGDNINGPSLIRVPEWIESPLGKYYLYFAHHRGTYIRLAYADHLDGPWSIYSPGTLTLEASTCADHIASPDVHVDEAQRQIRMYFHGHAYADPATSDGLERLFDEARPWVGTQRSKVAVSNDGLHFAASAEVLGAPYFRVFSWEGMSYALAMPGMFLRSADRSTAFERGPVLFAQNFRHPAVYRSGHVLHVFYTNAGDCPERILQSAIDLRPEWMAWSASEPTIVLEPEQEYEGAALPLRPSARGPAPGAVREVRDPAIFEEGGELFLLYSVAGEQGIAVARLHDV